MLTVICEKKDAKTLWLEEGLRILASKGPGALSIENLTIATGKTKGSFYHHFTSRDQYQGRLLEYYEKTTTDDIIEVTGEGNDTRARLKKLTELTFRISGDLELAIRAWALFDPMVRTFQDRLDRRRLEYLKELHISSGKETARARTLSYRDYSLYLGLQQLIHHNARNEFYRILKEIFPERASAPPRNNRSDIPCKNSGKNNKVQGNK